MNLIIKIIIGLSIIGLYLKTDLKTTNNSKKKKKPNIIFILSDDHQNIVKKLKTELYNLKKEYGNELSLADMRRISETEFGGLESNKSKK